MRHIRAARLCTSGGREWFAAHGFDWGDFLVNGIPAAKLEATRDPLAAKPAALARKEAEDGQF